MKTCIWYLMCSAFLLTAPGTSLFADLSAPDSGEPLKCTKEELISFFPEHLVEKVLTNSGIPGPEAGKIARELAKKEPELAKMVEEKALQVSPHPFKDLSQRDRALKVYNDTLYEVFAGVVTPYGIKDETRIRHLLDQIRVERSKHFIECIQSGKKLLNPDTAPEG